MEYTLLNEFLESTYPIPEMRGKMNFKLTRTNFQQLSQCPCHCHHCQCSWKVPVFVSFTDKNFKCLTEIKILSVQMSDTKIQDILHRTRICLTENYSVWHDVSFCQTECLTSLKSFQEVCIAVVFYSHYHVFTFVLDFLKTYGAWMKWR